MPLLFGIANEETQAFHRRQSFLSLGGRNPIMIISFNCLQGIKKQKRVFFSSGKNTQ